MYLRGKNRYKQNSVLEVILREKTKSFVTQDECTDIVNYMYNKKDSLILLEKLQDLYTYQDFDEKELRQLTREERIQYTQKRKMNTPQLKYQELAKTILDFQLKSHNNFLRQFIQQFIRVDLDRNGILNEVPTTHP